MRNKIPQWKLAWDGKITQHPRFMLEHWLDMLELVERKIALLEREVADKCRPFEATVQSWMQVPGWRRINAYSLLAEIGADMNQFPTASHLASWAAVSRQSGEWGQAAQRKDTAGKSLVAENTV